MHSYQISGFPSIVWMYMLLYPRTGGVKGEKKLLKASSPALR